MKLTLKVNDSMVFRIFDIALGKREVGFTLGSFLWDDDDFRSLLGLVHQREMNVTVLYILFTGIAMDWDGRMEDEDE